MKPCRQGTHERTIERCRSIHGPVTVVTPRLRRTPIKPMHVDPKRVRREQQASRGARPPEALRRFSCAGDVRPQPEIHLALRDRSPALHPLHRVRAGVTLPFANTSGCAPTSLPRIPLPRSHPRRRDSGRRAHGARGSPAHIAFLRRHCHLHHTVEPPAEDAVCLVDVRELEAMRDERTEVEPAAAHHVQEAAHPLHAPGQSVMTMRTPARPAPNASQGISSLSE